MNALRPAARGADARLDESQQGVGADTLAGFLLRRLAELIGAVLILAGLSFFLALLTADANDPSFNRATGQAAQNLLGTFGAGFADFMLQSLGLAAASVGLAFFAWGWHLIGARRLSLWWVRLALLPPSAVILALLCAVFSQTQAWPFPAGLGGLAGRLSLSGIGKLLAIFTPGLLVDAPEVRFAIAGAALLLGLAGLYVAFGIPLRGYVRFGSLVLATARATVRALIYLGHKARAFAHFATRLYKTRAADAPRFDARRLDGSEPSLAAAARRGMDAGDAAPCDAIPGDDDLLPGAIEANPDHTLGHVLSGGLRDGEPYLSTPFSSATGASPGFASPPVVIPEPSRPKRVETPARAPQPAKAKAQQSQRQAELDLDAGDTFELPPLDFLAEAARNPAAARINEEGLEKNARLLESVLDDFGVKGEIVKVRPGPVVTLYELEPAPGTKTARVVGLADDIARSMSAVSVRIAVVPGRSVIGIELPNHTRETVSLRALLEDDSYQASQAKLALVLGKDIGGAPIVVDLARMPHLLIAGTTGSGKSVAINTMILSLLYRLTPQQCKFIMIDPKMLELSVYDGIPHLLAPVVTEPRKAIVALKWVVREMENRYRAMSKLGVRNVEGYNQRLAQARKAGETLTRKVQTGFEPETGKPIYEEEPFDLTPLPFIVVVVDEMADLMLVAGKEIEAAIQRLAQMARAAGIHIVMATQRPSVDVITGTIKANFPTRISFHVTTKIDSRTILGETGAEQLLGQGDMLYMANGGRIARVHGPFVSDREVDQIVSHLKNQAAPSYVEDVTAEDEAVEDEAESGDNGGGGGDALYDRAVAIVCRERKASTSFVQRHLQIGYNRAARIVERMEKEGVVSPANHVGKREVLARNIEGMD